MKIFTVKELARYLKISERSIYTYVKEDRVPYYKVGGQFRFDEDEIIEWLKEKRMTGLARLRTIKSPLERRLYFVALLTKNLAEEGVRPILVGGNAVELYTTGGYSTADIDIVAPTSPVDKVLKSWGFSREGRYWVNEELDIQIEAPSAMLAGDYGKVTRVKIEDLELFVIGIEDIIIDRLNAYTHWKSEEDRSWAKEMIDINGQRIDWQYLKNRSEDEGALKALEQILKELQIT